MKIRLTGTGEFNLDGEYELEPHPNTRELTRFRKEAGMSPSEVADALSLGGIEVVPLYVYTALQRQGRSADAVRVLDVPFDVWAGADLDKKGADAEDPDEQAEEEPEQLPPT